MDENGRWFISYWDPASFTGDMLVSQLSSYFSSLFPLKRPVCDRPFGGRNGLISMDVNGGMVAGVFINWMVVSLSLFHGEQSQNCPMLGTPCRLFPLWNTSTSSPPPSNSPNQPRCGRNKGGCTIQKDTSHQNAIENGTRQDMTPRGHKKLLEDTPRGSWGLP